MSMSEIIAVVRPIADRLTIPLICDADHAGETPLNVYRTVRDFESAGVAGIHIEDSYNPKHAVVGKLRPVAEMCGRLQAAVDGRTDSNFAIIARTDVFYNYRRRTSGDGSPDEAASVDEIIERGIAYAEAGADVFMPVEMEPKHIDRVADAVPIPVLDVNQQMRLVSESKLKVNVYTAFGIVAMAQSFHEILRKLRDHGEYDWSNEKKGVFPDGYGDLRDEALYREIATGRRS
jgi:methylisocitrate lyase